MVTTPPDTHMPSTRYYAGLGCLMATMSVVPSGSHNWRALRESNPCFRRERAASWTARRRALNGKAERGGHIKSFAGVGKQRGNGLSRPPDHHFPSFGIDAQGSFGGSGLPFCRSSIECLSGERTNAILPSRGGRLMVTPAFISFSQIA
jgi:hypothetical protein